MTINLKGNAESSFSDDVTITGDLSAAGGTFSGDLTAADGTFAGGRTKIVSDGNVELRDASNNLVLSLG